MNLVTLFLTREEADAIDKMLDAVPVQGKDACRIVTSIADKLAEAVKEVFDGE